MRPAAGGAVPKARSLSSALRKQPPGVTRVVCQGRVPSTRKVNRLKRRLRAARRRKAARRKIRRLKKQLSRARKRYRRGVRRNTSIRRLRRSLASARRSGYRIRPSQPTIRMSKRQRARLLKLNERLLARCKTKSVQTAVTRSRNNDRVVIMPGRYTEPASRRQRTNDPRCNPRLLSRDASGDLTPSYAYQVTCPNDQNLIHLAGRSIGANPPPSPPLDDRRGIPDVGPCIRCNVQIEGSGVKAEDVVLDAGTKYGGKEGDPESKPGAFTKHVVFRSDRSDGLVMRNVLFKGAREHGFYTEETDGVLLDRVKFFWNADYGHLSFTSDHHRVQNCDGFGSGDSVVYPGAAPETGAQTSGFWPDAPRANTTITKCDLRGSALGYSGSMGNAVRITGNHIYGNTTGIASDTLSSAGHPGFPADSSRIDNNLIYSNNLDLYRPDAPVKALVTVPIGTGIIYAGMNDARVHDNWFFDNWREGARLLAVPDALVSGGGAEGDIFPGVSCPGAPANGISTSCGNRYYNNHVGVAPPGFRFPAAVDQFGVARSSGSSRAMPNGVDFEWDEFSGNTGNCWYGNVNARGESGTGTGPYPGSPPNTLPSNCESSTGPGDPAKTIVLIDCANGPDEETGPLVCPWWQVPPRPGSAAASRQAAALERAARRFNGSDGGHKLRERMWALSSR